MCKPSMAFILLLFCLKLNAQDSSEPRYLFKENFELSGGSVAFTPRFTNVLGTYCTLAGFSGGITSRTG